MLIVKMMSAENLDNDDCRKQFSLFTGIRHVRFNRSPAGEPWIEMTDERFEVLGYGIEGAVFVMNEAGKTISMFSPDPLPG